jgi:hypothetical protein
MLQSAFYLGKKVVAVVFLLFIYGKVQYRLYLCYTFVILYISHMWLLST